MTVSPQGSRRLYALNPTPLTEIERWVQRQRRFWEEQLDALEGAVVQDDERVEVRFADVADGTCVTITHRGPWQDASSAENYHEGWSFVLDALAASR